MEDRKKCPELEEWKNKLNEYEWMVKSTSYLYNRPILEFQEKWKAFFKYIADNQG